MPYNIVREGRKYKLYLIEGNKLLGTHTSNKKALSQIRAIEINKSGSGKPYKEIKGYRYFLSDKPNKKLMVKVNGKWLHFGDSRYQHYKDKTGLLPKEQNHLDPKRRLRYITRASNIVDKNGNYTFNNPESPNYHSMYILW